MDSLVPKLIEQAGPVAAGIAVVLLVLFFGLKWTGLLATIGDRKKLVDSGQMTEVANSLAGIKQSLDGLATRMTTVERDIEKRATQDEVHELEISFTRLEGRFDYLESTMKATAAGVTRIEDFMYEAALRGPRVRKDE